MPKIMAIGIGLTLAGCVLPTWAQSEPPPPKVQLYMPEGPYASWSEIDRKNGPQLIMLRCMLLNTLMHGSGKKSPADEEAALAFTMSCWAAEMPADWPELESTAAQAKEHAAAAKKIDPAYPEAAMIYTLLPSPNAAKK